MQVYDLWSVKMRKIIKNKQTNKSALRAGKPLK